VHHEGAAPKAALSLPWRTIDRSQDRGVDAASHIVLDAIAVLLRRESGCRPLAGIDTQPRTLDVLVIDDPLAIAGRDVVAARVVRNFDDFPEGLVRLLLARERIPTEDATTDSPPVGQGRATSHFPAQGIARSPGGAERALGLPQGVSPQFPRPQTGKPTSPSI
jgi:hypothetical protein